MNWLTSKEAAYIAGIVDGEGHLGLTRHINTNYNCYNISFHISNTNFKLINYLSNKISYCNVFEDYGKGNWKDSYRIKINKEIALSFLNLIEPYVIVKKEQVNILKEFINLTGLEQKRNKWKMLESSKVEKIKDLYLRLRIANERGFNSEQLSEFKVDEQISRVITKLTPEFIAYIAGIIDGEGCINLSLRDSGCYDLHISISNTNLYLLKLIQKSFNIGSIFDSCRYKENWKIFYSYSIRKYEMENFLKLIFNDLVAKRRQAELLLEFISLTRSVSNYKLRSYNYLPLEIKKRIKEIYYDIKYLNHKGKI